ncbi:hypothetical protein MA03_01690 [Infirmifilum uzonense]|uniref:Uncharacterized protein n=1 Tax=Infirmifilum uzonense TaxID=1550241 RepID=A0A0F7CKU1_9CREN|nr:hypothetical protein [Infirmifilum uzonense]AKG38251.1 hypothetical protein MA03_01690 [Infirmifilum uzonense]
MTVDLKCFDKIVVGPVKVKKRSSSIRYELHFNGVRKEYTLIQSYPEEVNIRGFEELAVLAGIVPAINYGLFTPLIEIKAPLHELDYKYFLDMMDITARDIFVNRIINKTGLIKEEYLPKGDVSPEDAKPIADVDVRETFTGTRLDSRPEEHKCTVMSSGGKESLLVYGLLREVGCEPYPYFVNESGRHWFTALTAYKGLSSMDPRTRKVWTNVDRLFAFIEKNMRIVVPYYWKKNKEIYPVRLFWYAHFIFSVLPLAVKNNVGNVTMGNEFDDPTGLTYEFNGIRHYYATYDQSLDFDDYMTSFMAKRGIGIKQWSPLRPITPIIVLRILFNRYPELGVLQTSCHSTRIEGGVVKPCGTCFKCNGVLLMMLAEGLDPTIIRYERKHIETLPERLEKGLIRLEESLVKHSKYLITQRGLWSFSEAEPVWHVEMIHFDNINARTDFIPIRELREKVLDIYEKYTKGYVYLVNGKWLPGSRPE